MNLDFINAILGTILNKRKPVDDIPLPPKLPIDRETWRTQITPPPIAPVPAPVIGTGTADVPVIDPTALTRPRVVDMPPPPIAPPVASPRAKLEGELATLDAKRYNKGVWKLSDGSTTSNPKKAAADPMAEVITAPGKDRDKKWSTVEKILGGLEGWATGGLAGGIRGATDRNFFEKQGDASQRARLLPQIAAQQEIDKFNTDEALRKAQTSTIPIDDANRQLQIEAQVQANKDRLKQLAQSSLFKAGYFDPKNPVHRKQADAAGIDPDTLKGWDDRNPLTKKVGDTTYQFNRESGEFEPSSLPKDEEKTLTTYDVVMPTGEKRTFKVSQSDAARFAQQMNVVGAQIASREKIAGNRITATKENTDARIAAAERAKNHVGKLDDKGKTAAIKQAYSTWLKRNPKATPEEQATAYKQLTNTFGTQ